MKQTFFLTLLSISAFMTVCSGQTSIADYISSSNSCDAINTKIIKLDRFTEVVKNTSAFHLEEKANALPSPGITVSNNKKKMLRDAAKKRAELLEEHEKYGCEMPIPSSRAQVADETAVTDEIPLSSDECTAIEKKMMKLDRFIEVVNNTSAFHLEEKAGAIPSPGITVSNNKKKMLRDAAKKRAELLEEHEKYGCETPMPSRNSQIASKMPVTDNTSLVSTPHTMVEKEPIQSTSKVTNTVVLEQEVEQEEKAVALVRQKTAESKQQEQTLKDDKKKPKEVLEKRQDQGSETTTPVVTTQVADTMKEVYDSVFSSEECSSLAKDLIKLDKFTNMVKNTSAFHLEEKASALPSPGITVSNNKKKMLRDAKKKRAEILKEREKYGCETLEE